MANQRPAAASKEIYVSFSAGINLESTEGLITIMTECVKQRAATVHLLFSSDGGSVMHGVNLYNVLRGLPFKLVTHNVGNVDSIGNAIFLAGEERYACQHSTFMFHGVGAQFNGILKTKDVRENLAMLQADESRISSIVEQRSKLTEATIRAFFDEAHTMDAAEALSSGLVDDIRDVSIPNGSTMFTLSSKRQG
jgi:ATP-dependent Clp protease protease subunit